MRIIENKKTVMSATSNRVSHRWPLLAMLAMLATLGFFTGAQQALAQADLTGTRSSSFTYYDANAGVRAGLLQSETVEPGDPQRCVTTTYTYDDTGNKTGSSTANCSGATGRALFTPRGSNSTYAAQTVTVSGVAVTVPAGAFVDTATNALGQQETRRYDPRFGVATRVTGPNQITTNWELDDFGRSVKEVRADGTYTVMSYCLLGGAGVDTSSNSDTCPTLSDREVPDGSWSFVNSQQYDVGNQPMSGFTRVFSDRAGRKLRTVTQGYDGVSAIDGQAPVGGGARLIAQDVGYTDLGVQNLNTQPYFLDSGNTNADGSGGHGATYTVVDALGRPVSVYSRDNQGRASFPLGGGAATLAQATYQGLKTINTNDSGQQRTEEKSVDGKLVRVTDELGAQVAHRYDPFGNLLSTVDALGNVIRMAYDIRGRKISMDDPDSGHWDYDYNALGELVWQRSAKQQVDGTDTVMAYDVLGRMTQRVEAEYTSTWTFDRYADGSVCTGGVGKLCESATSTLVQRRYVYDTLGRPLNSKTTVAGGPSFGSAVSYDARGRLSTQTYPTGLQVVYQYSTLGFVQSLNLGATQVVVAPEPDATGTVAAGITLAPGSPLWAPKTYNARGQVQEYSYGNLVVNQAGYDSLTGQTMALGSGLKAGSEVLSLNFGWDNLGRLKTRTDGNGAGGNTGAVSDDLVYDDLGRLKTYTVSAPQVPNLARTVELRYNAGGMLIYKSDVGIYSYGVAGHAHALSSVNSLTAGISSASYGYDAGGNLVSATAGKYRSLAYTSFNMPASQGANGAGAVQGAPGGAAYGWFYDENHQRLKEVRTDASGTRTTWMLHPDNSGGLSFESETMVGAGATTTRNRHYLSVAGSAIGVIITADALPTLTTAQTAPATVTTINAVRLEYWHKDILGSLITTTDHLGAVTARYSYDPFGKRRQANGTYDAAGVLVVDWVAQANYGTDRGYTGHEHLDDVGLIHMNGRIYDPTLGLFLQADPMIQSPDDLQNYNRYGYCFNNPMTCSDPTGYSFLSKWLGSSVLGGVVDFFVPGLGTTLSGLYQARMIARTRVGYQLGSIVIGVVSAVYCQGGAAACNALGQAGWAALAGHSAADVVRTGAMAYVSAWVNNQIGSTFDVDEGMVFSNTLAHGVWGCAEGELNGGSCGAGFRGGLAGAALSNYANVNVKTGDRIFDVASNTLIHATTGGLASLAGGGKFSEGAKSAAYAYLFNALMHITGGMREGTNPFGHTALAVGEGGGVYSYGNSTPLGSDPLTYIQQQSLVRDQLITIIPTTPDQDAAAVTFFSAHPGMNSVGILDNCSVRTSEALIAASVPVGGSPFPGGLARQTAALPGVQTLYIPKGGEIPQALVTIIKQQFTPPPRLPKQQ